MLRPAFTLAGFPLREALEQTGLGVVTADTEGRITMMSPALEELLQFASTNVEGGTGEELGLRHPGGEPMSPEETPLSRASRGEFVKNVVVGAQDRSGQVIWLRCNGAPMRDEHGAPLGAWVLTQDITAQQRAEELQDQLRARLVHTLNHEFRTPLAAMLGNLEVVRDHHVVDDPELVRSLAAIERAAWRLCHLVGTAATLIEKQEELHQGGRQPDGAPHRPD